MNLSQRSMYIVFINCVVCDNCAVFILLLISYFNEQSKVAYNESLADVIIELLKLLRCLKRVPVSDTIKPIFDLFQKTIL